MPRVFQAVNISEEEKEVRKDYFDRHMPRIICDESAREGEKFKVKIILGDEYPHPDVPEHYISYIQLWNRETFIAEAHFTPGMLGNTPGHVEVDFFIVPGPVSMNLSAMAVCTNHGLWQSESKEVKVSNGQ
ncbi:desulfoferrodoxin family protein [Bacteroidota bacterium]